MRRPLPRVVDDLAAATSEDGTWVAFSTTSANVIPTDPGPGIFLRNYATGEVTRVSSHIVGAPHLGLSENGRYVTFVTSTTGQFGNPENHVFDRVTSTHQAFGTQYQPTRSAVVPDDGSAAVYRWDTQGPGSGTVQLIGTAESGTEAGVPLCDLGGAVANSGAMCLLTTEQLDPIDNNGLADAYLAD